MALGQEKHCCGLCVHCDFKITTTKKIRITYPVTTVN